MPAAASKSTPAGGGGAPAKSRGKFKVRSATEKKERIWGHNPQKPYISSSIGDMTRVMMRLACMENTFFYDQEPPPAEFYNYWKKFSVEEPKKPEEFVDTKKQSIPHLKKNTSSFNFYGRYAEKIVSNTDVDDAGGDGKRGGKKRIVTVDDKRISEIWKDVRISMSKESFISASTKISENASNVQLETAWNETCSEDYVSSESDFGFDVQDHHRHHRHDVPYWNLLTDSQTIQEDKVDSSEFATPQGLLAKQANMITQSLLDIQKRDNRILVGLANKPNTMDIIDYFADDLDDSFLLDSVSYTNLPDNAFGPDFDFFNEDTLTKTKKKKGKRGGRKGSTGGEDEEGDDDDDSSECLEDEEACLAAKKKKARGRTSTMTEDASQSSLNEGGYEACIERRKKKIEDNLRAAVRCRSPMGSYKPPPGGEPLSRALQSRSPGPAAYNPSVAATKPKVLSPFLSSRWKDNSNKSYGPGPAYMVEPAKCTCEMLTLHEAPRFKEVGSLGPGPGEYNLSKHKGTAVDAPHALILSRKNLYRSKVNGEYVDIHGMTRFGPVFVPKPLIMSKNYLRDRISIGPGEYDPSGLKDRRIGILIKSRIPRGGNEVPPDYVMIPRPIGESGAFTFGLKNAMQLKAQSPGPIYQIERSKRKPVSLTFRPFPTRGREDDPSPLEWGNKPGNDKIKTLPQAPRTLIRGNHDMKNKFKTPAPNHYDICYECLDYCMEPGASFKGKHPIKTCNYPGPGAYSPRYPWGKIPPPVFQNRWNDPSTRKGEEYKKGGCPYGGDEARRIIGGVMAPRWREREDEEDSPDFPNVFGMTNRGNITQIPISLKSRHSPFKYSYTGNPGHIHYKQGACAQADIKDENCQ